MFTVSPKPLFLLSLNSLVHVSLNGLFLALYFKRLNSTKWYSLDVCVSNKLKEKFPNTPWCLKTQDVRGKPSSKWE